MDYKDTLDINHLSSAQKDLGWEEVTYISKWDWLLWNKDSMHIFLES